MPVGKLVFNMSLPMMVSMLVQALYNIVDSIFVAKLSENALTAVSLAFPLQTLLIAVATGTGVGMNALLSKSLGEHNFKKANKIADNAAFIYAISYIVFLILGFTIVRPFYASQIGNADVEIMELGIDYLSTVMIFSFGLFTQIFFERLLTSTGRTIFSMTSQLCGAITNIILDPIMIFGLLGFPKMGVTGAAVATVIGQCVAGIVAGACNHKYNHDVSLSFKGFRPDIRLIGHIYAVGIPSIIMQSIGSIMTYSMNRILIEFSSTATAVFGVYFKLQSFFFMPVFGLNNGITPIIAYNYGAQQRNRMIKTIRISLTTAFCLTFIGFLCFEGIPQVLLGMFNASDAMLKIGVPALRIIGIHYLIAWFCIIAGTVFQALGKAVFSMVVSIMRQLVVLIPSAYIFARCEFRFKKAFFYVLLITRMSPGAVFVIPYFIAYKELGLLDTYIGLTLIYFASNLGIIVWSLRAFMEDIPISLEEAARIDGCSLLQTLFRISIPLATPGIASTAILSFIFSWNEFLFALLLTRQKVQTAPIGVLNFIVFEKMNWGVIAAGAIVIALPVIFFGIAIRKYYVKGLTQGGLAGD